MSNTASNLLTKNDKMKDIQGFASRHIGPSKNEIKEMLKALGFSSIEEFTNSVLPDQIKLESEFSVSEFSDSLSEQELISYYKKIASKNKVYRSYIGCGYYGTHTPTVIQRNILENPGWYTQYTPYQPEISQGRLEALLNYQTLVCDLTGMDVANASLLDEATACAEAMYLAFAVKQQRKNSSGKNKDANKFFIDINTFPQNISIIKTRAEALGIEVVIADYKEANVDENYFGALVQYPSANGEINDYQDFSDKLKSNKALFIVASDLMALSLLKAPSEFGADIVLGSSQRFGVPMGFGGPHAAFFATKKDYQRIIPGRLVGLSKDRNGNPALRLALQTREQHIRREKATSNICTAQVLLAIMASMYAVYNGPKRILKIANRINAYASSLKQSLTDAGLEVVNSNFFDTLEIKVSGDEILKRAEEKEINLGLWKENSVVVALDETTRRVDVDDILYVLTGKVCSASEKSFSGIPNNLARENEILTQEVFNKYHSETEFLRYVKRLEAKDLSLTASMIPLGSCTMKLNATSEMLAVTWEEFSNIHPLTPKIQVKGYLNLINSLEKALCDITGFSAVSLQPNAGSQGEYAGLLAIKRYLEATSEDQRDICLIPKSAHGTNPASAVIAGLKVVVVNCDDNGNVDLEDLKLKVEENSKSLAALMVTYPSTHGVFEESIKDICKIIHEAGGQVYLDGANLNAMVGLSKPAELGADVMHINLHKTFAIPHGGGGPGVGPIGVASHLKDFLPGDPQESKSVGAVSAANYGSASILPISLAYIAMLGNQGMKQSTQVAILNANYIAKELEDYYPVLYKGKNNHVAHECILDCREFKKELNIEVEDIAKRLMDYAFHAPTVSWPVAGTIMIEPTESESKGELDRFIRAMRGIYAEIEQIRANKHTLESNMLKNAPHTAFEATKTDWSYSYTREEAVYPDEFLKTAKFWPSTARIDSAYGDRNLVCTCPDLEDYL